MTELSKNTQVPQCDKTDVMRGYFGLPLDFKLVSENGGIIFISNTHADFLTLSKLDLSKFKMQQFTGIVDRNKTKIYFGDTLRFADKWEWYRGTWACKLMNKVGKERELLEKEYDKLPYEERLIENNEDFEWLLSSEIQSYWEVLV